MAKRNQGPDPEPKVDLTILWADGTSTPLGEVTQEQMNAIITTASASPYYDGFQSIPVK